MPCFTLGRLPIRKLSSRILSGKEGAGISQPSVFSLNHQTFFLSLIFNSKGSWAHSCPSTVSTPNVFSWYEYYHSAFAVYSGCLLLKLHNQAKALNILKGRIVGIWEKKIFSVLVPLNKLGLEEHNIVAALKNPNGVSEPKCYLSFHSCWNVIDIALGLTEEKVIYTENQKRRTH